MGGKYSPVPWTRDSAHKTFEPTERARIPCVFGGDLVASGIEPRPSSLESNEGCGSPVVRVLDHGRHVMSSSPVPQKTRRVGQRCTLKRLPIGVVR
ncbi:hypothetical protein TNCV_831051 [Trichonephila clavipes]|nr:hypothetical protein TNCV_831051 [Trichonephila clavipes]